MSEIRVNPTRMEQKKLKVRLLTARRGHKLLKDKRDELMRQFLAVVREDKELRISVEKRLCEAHKSFSVASALTSPLQLREALMLPMRHADLSVEFRNVMSVNVPVFSSTITSVGGEGEVGYGFAFTSGELDSAVSALGGMLSDLLRLAELEKTAGLLADEIEKTRRRVNALEYIMIPQLETAIKGITMKLDENERGNLTRLMKVKDMMLEEKMAADRMQDAEDEPDA